MGDVKQRHPFHIDALVVLPDHLHALWTLPEGDCDYPMRWMLIKAGFSRQLAKLVGRLPSKINLIPYNPGEGVGPKTTGQPGYAPPTTEVVERFARYLEPRTGAVMVRATQGHDILAACGQLAQAAPFKE